MRGSFDLCSILVFIALLGGDALAATEVTSREQFGRLLPGSLPTAIHYNAERAWLELRVDHQNCRGEVTKARVLSNSRTANLGSQASAWVKNILLKIRFRPLNVGAKATSVHTFTTVVCQ